MTTEELFQQLKHPNPHLRDQAMWALAENPDATVIPRLMSILDEDDTTYRRAAVKALGAIGPDAVTPLVEALLNSENVTVRGSAAKALAQVAINHPDVPFAETGVQGLKTALNDPNPVVHIAAVMALGEIGSPVVDVLIEALQTTDNPALGISLVNALASIGDPKAIDVLKSVIENESTDSYVRESATSALSRAEMTAKFQRGER
ncbi:HEAT repeat domain-containing protein [Nostoc sp. CMAA1605]|uniref:HEAT repeat domain-containing protein n=1 Tax=Nostoc sp. CMAA1605 TaxID=2055159 RepID=UPI001F20DF01|nr:HEAT repeat domain-containing protein [Nostoc sp. CMAA1605]MCF4970007.1 phycocyanin operon protein Z [Nostoc sp. CMAA1605]